MVLRILFQISILFQSTPSVGRATVEQLGFSGAVTDISIHALRGEGDNLPIFLNTFDGISIHALRGEGDGYKADFSGGAVISIHALRGEGDDSDDSTHYRMAAFQSTPSVGRATLTEC